MWKLLSVFLLKLGKKYGNPQSLVCVKSLSPVRLLATPWTAAHQAPPSMGFSRREYWRGVPLSSPGKIGKKIYQSQKWKMYHLWENLKIFSHIWENLHFVSVKPPCDLPTFLLGSWYLSLYSSFLSIRCLFSGHLLLYFLAQQEWKLRAAHNTEFLFLLF